MLLSGRRPGCQPQRRVEGRCRGWTSHEGVQFDVADSLLVTTKRVSDFLKELLQQYLLAPLERCLSPGLEHSADSGNECETARGDQGRKSPVP